MHHVVLRFIAGKQQGREFPLKDDCLIVMGRTSDADLIIAEEVVSRKHAVVTAQNGHYSVEDFSKNGTFVNGRRISTKTVIHPGDQLQIGASILKVMRFAVLQTPSHSIEIPLREPAPDADAPSFAPPPAGGGVAVQSAPALATSTVTAVSKPLSVHASHADCLRGSLSSIALVDLLQLLSGARKSGNLILRCADTVGRIVLVNGQITYALLDETPPVNPQKVLYRLLRWTEGAFEFQPPDGRTYDQPITGSTESLLLEAMCQLDEITNLGPALPPLHAELTLAQPLPAPLRDLEPAELDFIQLVLHHKLVRDILDYYTGTDFEAYTYLKSLLSRKFIELAPL
jgi:pSer/pThr/pTyr-binding forkhead associated (FHA) protein